MLFFTYYSILLCLLLLPIMLNQVTYFSKIQKENFLLVIERDLQH